MAGVRARLTAADLPPVVVLLGGPSAEHDVSVVSGTAIAEALSDTGASVSQVLIEVPPVASLSAVRNVLRYDAFVAQRYRLERILDQGRGNLESGSKGVLGLRKL